MEEQADVEVQGCAEVAEPMDELQRPVWVLLACVDGCAEVALPTDVEVVEVVVKAPTDADAVDVDVVEVEGGVQVDVEDER
ncbi:hypothetical protein LTR56_017367 [Elasticomyces elasticus]|nr:hypothetical protein LTR56_017367 [Elasticomyces elasticus]KAK3639051.1 hypothetical protein LTR22_017579 [Elasticomyces elasticus]KAK4915651.1 hypothetical protein LTR49_016253 [Elasticomyces elasticus]KAK5752637.1 hypothetical protein LTS12_017300 [Elasticomyces elasticus]